MFNFLNRESQTFSGTLEMHINQRYLYRKKLLVKIIII